MQFSCYNIYIGHRPVYYTYKQNTAATCFYRYVTLWYRFHIATVIVVVPMWRCHCHIPPIYPLNAIDDPISFPIRPDFLQQT